jgi:hypothetical protein
MKGSAALPAALAALSGCNGKEEMPKTSSSSSSSGGGTSERSTPVQQDDEEEEEGILYSHQVVAKLLEITTAAKRAKAAKLALYYNELGRQLLVEGDPDLFDAAVLKDQYHIDLSCRVTWEDHPQSAKMAHIVVCEVWFEVLSDDFTPEVKIVPKPDKKWWIIPGVL